MNDNLYAMHYDIARIVRILTIFEPVELKDPDEYEYPSDNTVDNTGGSTDSVPDPDVNQ